MVGVVNHEKIISAAFSAETMGKIRTGINLAYSCADQLVEGNEILNWDVGHGFLGYLRNIAVEFQLKYMAECDRSGISYRLAPNHGHNYNHVEIVSRDCIMTVSQVHHKFACPRKAIYRNLLATNNQEVLEGFQRDEERGEGDEHYLILTHGTMRNELWQEPAFIGIGYPTSECNGWNAYVDLTRCDNGGFILEDSSLREAEEALKIELETAITNVKNA